MRRRAALLALLSAALPKASFAQGKAPAKRLAVLFMRFDAPTTPESRQRWLQPLEAHGFRVGQNLEVLWEDSIVMSNTPEKIESAVERIVKWRPDCITTAGESNIEAVRKATQTIPVVADTNSSDPIDLGIAKSLERPGGNFTGLHPGANEVNLKRVQIMAMVVPRLTCVGWIAGGAQLGWFPAYERAARQAGLRVHKVVFHGSDKPNYNQLRADLAALARDGCSAAHFNSAVPEVIKVVTEFAAERRMVLSLSGGRPLSETPGVLFSYFGVQQTTGYGNWGRTYALIARVLRGESPASIPFEGPTAYRFQLSLAAAEKLRIAIPPEVRLMADELIQ